MSNEERVVIVGCGHMGLAIAQGLLGATPGRRVLLVEQDAQRREMIAAELRGHDGLSIASTPDVGADDFVVLAIPPQGFDDFARREGHRFTPATPVLSVMAGITSSAIARALGSPQVVRCIPNTPSEVFEGMSVYYADPLVPAPTVERADLLLRSIGRALRVPGEEMVDDATAICGGGPAFVSYMVDAFCQFARTRGFDDGDARQMAAQVFGGTAKLIAASEKEPMRLCREVMTPNGTTERGIAALESANVRNSILTALDASARRSRELASAAHPVRTPGVTDA